MDRFIKANKCKNDGVVIVTVKDRGQALYQWWSDMTGWTQEKGLPPTYGPKLVAGQDRYKMMKNIGVSFDIKKIRTAMNAIAKGKIIERLGGENKANDANDLMGMLLN